MSHQKTSGKTSGAPFISDPGTLVFRDFVVGEMMEIDFTLINASFARNTYQIKGFDPEFSSLFNLISSPPGYISPGFSVPLSLQFTPKFNKHIVTDLHFLAKTGPFDVRVECIPRSINIQFEPFEKFDLGSVTIGEETEGKLVLRNTGALKSTWSLQLENVSSDSNSMALQDAERLINFSIKQGAINGYSTSSIMISFAPERPCVAKFDLKFRFTSPDGEFDSFVKELPFVAVGLDVPVFLETDSIDFGVCFYDELYRTILSAHNRSNISQRFAIELPQDLDMFIEFQPKSGFIQPQSSLNITTKVRLNSKFDSIFQHSESQVVDIPMKIVVFNQVLPVPFSFKLVPSKRKLVFDPPRLDFGTLITTESKTLDMKITSLLQVPVNFGFIRLPNGVEVQPFDGFGVLVPKESLCVSVTFSSPLPKRHEFDITIATLQGSKFKVPCVANIVSSPLLFSATNIQFEATPIGEESYYVLKVSNTKKQPIEIEFETPEDFYFDPIVSTIQPGQESNITITFRPKTPVSNPKPLDVDSVDKDSKQSSQKGKKTNPKDKKTEKAGKSEEKESTTIKTEIVDPDFTYKIHNISFACFWKSGNSSGRHHINVKAAAILPQLFVTGIHIGSYERTSDNSIDLLLRKIDYGTVALGQSRDASITLYNAGKKELQIGYDVDVGSFEILTPSCVINPKSFANVTIRFHPSVQAVFTSKVLVRSLSKPNIKTTLYLSGSAAGPSIDLSADSVEFGHVMVGHIITRSIHVKNNAGFAFKYVYKLEPEKGMHHTNMDNTEAFRLEKSSEWLDPGSTGTCIVSFNSDHDDLEFSNKLIISAGEGGLSREIPITASSWPHTMFIMGGTEDPRYRTAFDYALLDEPYFRPSVVCEMSYPGPTAQTSLLIGVSQTNGDSKRSFGDFTFDNISVPGFVISPMKANIESGGATKVLIEYSPSNQSMLQFGQWVVVESNINLKYGDFVKKVPIKLKCLISIQRQQNELPQEKLMASGNDDSTPKKKSKK